MEGNYQVYARFVAILSVSTHQFNGPNLQNGLQLAQMGQNWPYFQRSIILLAQIVPNGLSFVQNGPKWLKMGQIAQLIIIILSVFTYQFNGPKFAKMGFK